MHNSRSSKTLCAAALSLVLAAVAPAQAAQAPSLDDALARIGEYAPQAMQQQGAPGMMLAVTDASHTLRLYPVGFADAQSKTPVTAQTRFGIGSLSKSMTSVALLQLRDAGRFDPERTVAAYLPWFSIHTKWRPITSHDLFTHTSGLPDGGLSTGYSAIYGLRDWMTGFAPGTHWSYSNVGYDTLGAILETLDRANYQAIVQRRVFAPLGMNDTTAEWSPHALESAASGYLYRADDGALPPDPTLMPSPTTHYVDAAGSVLSTGEDMAKYMRFLLTDKAGAAQLLSAQSYALLTSPGKTDGHELGSQSDGMYHRYGYGLAVMDVNGDKVVAHTGGVLSYTACMMVDLTRGFGAVALSNLGYVGPRPCAIVSYAIEALQAQALGKDLPAIPKVADPAHVAKAGDYAGTYQAPNGTSFTVTASGEKLALTQDGVTSTMYPRGKDEFFVDSPPYATFDFIFTRDKAGNVVDASYGSQWFANAKYSGPRSFTYPASWNAYTGEYQSMDPNGYFNVTHVYVLKGKLVADGAPLVAQRGGIFHVGTQLWQPQWLRFAEPVAGKTQIVTSPGQTLYRVNPY